MKQSCEEDYTEAMDLVKYRNRVNAVNILALIFLFLVLFVFVFCAHAQEKKVPFPPDLIHVTRPSCTVLEHGVAEVLNVKTGQTEERTNFRVEPFATYDDNRDRWELPEETMSASKEKRPGSIGDYSTSHEAIDACYDWIKSVKEARKKEIESSAHSTKK